MHRKQCYASGIIHPIVGHLNGDTYSQPCPTLKVQAQQSFPPNHAVPLTPTHKPNPSTEPMTSHLTLSFSCDEKLDRSSSGVYSITTDIRQSGGMLWDKPQTCEVKNGQIIKFGAYTYGKETLSFLADESFLKRWKLGDPCALTVEDGKIAAKPCGIPGTMGFTLIGIPMVLVSKAVDVCSSTANLPFSRVHSIHITSGSELRVDYAADA